LGRLQDNYLAFKAFTSLPIKIIPNRLKKYLTLTVHDLFKITVNDDQSDMEETLAGYILDNMTEGVCLLTTEMQVAYWNKAATIITGVSMDIIAGKKLISHFTTTECNHLLRKYAFAKNIGRSVEFEIYVSSILKWLKIKMQPSGNKTIIFFKIITRHKKLVKNLQSTAQLFKDIVNNTSDLIWTVNEAYLLQTANKAFNCHGHAPEQWVKNNQLNNNLFNITMAKHYNHALLGKKFTITEKLQNSDKQPALYFEITFVPIYEVENNKVAGVTCYARDVTEQIYQQKKVEESNCMLRQKEKILLETTENLQTIINSSPDIICTTDPMGRFLQMNDACKNMLGYQPADMIGKLFTDFMHTSDQANSFTLAEQVKNDSKSSNTQNRFVAKNNEVLPMLWSVNRNAKRDAYFWVGKSITALANAEKQRNEAELQFKALIEKGVEMVAIVDSHGIYKFVGHNIKQNLGYDEVELVGKSAFDYIHPNDQQKVSDYLKNILITGEPIKEEGRFIDKNGEWKWIEVVATNLLNDPAVKGIVINSRDITDRKLKDEKLKTTNERLKTVLDIVNEVIWEWDLSSGEIIINRSYQRIFGVTDQMQATTFDHWLKKIHPNDRTRIKDSIIQKLVANEQKQWREEYQYLKADGTYAFVLHRGLLVMNEGGQPQKMVGAMKDITQRKRYELEREFIIKELTESNDDLKQFSFITSHNLRAPLSNMVGLLNIIDKKTLESGNCEVVEMLSQSVEQLNETVADLTKIIVMRSRSEIQNRQTNIAETFENEKNKFLNALKDISYHIITDFKAKDTTLYPPYLESIFSNLLSNSIKFRNKNVLLIITVGSSVSCFGELTITFADNGIGINLRRINDRLFGMYQRFHTNNDGKGMGLYMVKSQVVAMGGKITVESTEGMGTMFTIKLPMKNDQ